MDNLIECQNLTHYYGKRLIYRDLSFAVPRGRILGLLGKNGTGKTTTINILSGFLRPKSGVCRILGEDITRMPDRLRQDIGLLIEGHVQYSFMTIRQIEHFYAPFYPKWRREAYYELMELLKVTESQHLSRMSCGQRSQVALGLLLAQNPKVLILDDFSMGLDPGYRRLFVDYLHHYAKEQGTTIFLTSHIIQDMERLIDDCIIMDYGSILLQRPVAEILNEGRLYRCTLTDDRPLPEIDGLYHFEAHHRRGECYSFLPMPEVAARLTQAGVPYQDLTAHETTLEDAFIGLTGKY